MSKDKKKRTLKSYLNKWGVRQVVTATNRVVGTKTFCFNEKGVPFWAVTTGLKEFIKKTDRNKK